MLQPGREGGQCVGRSRVAAARQVRPRGVVPAERVTQLADADGGLGEGSHDAGKTWEQVLRKGVRRLRTAKARTGRQRIGADQRAWRRCRRRPHGWSIRGAHQPTAVCPECLGRPRTCSRRLSSIAARRFTTALRRRTVVSPTSSRYLVAEILQVFIMLNQTTIVRNLTNLTGLATGTHRGRHCPHNALLSVERFPPWRLLKVASK